MSRARSEIATIAAVAALAAAAYALGAFVQKPAAAPASPPTVANAAATAEVVQPAALPNGQQPFAVAPDGQPICMGRLGPGVCAQVAAVDAHLQGQGMPVPGQLPPGMAPGMPVGGMTPPIVSPMPMPGPSGPMGPQPTGMPMPIAPGPFPGAGLLPQDGQITMEIARKCGGEPTCMGTAWMSVEVSRCRNGVFQPGGCFGPNGEIVKAINVILNDVQHGPGPNNDIFGTDGWLCQRLGC